MGDFQVCISVPLRNAFFSLKLNKSPGYDEISFNVIKKCFSELCEPLKHVFNFSIETGVFPDKLKTACVTHKQFYKAYDIRHMIVVT